MPASPTQKVGRGASNSTYRIIGAVCILMLVVFFVMINTSYKTLFSTGSLKQGGSSGAGKGGGALGLGFNGLAGKKGEMEALVKAQAKAKAKAGGMLRAIQGQSSGAVDQELLKDVKRLQRAIKLMDDQIESLSDRIEIEEPLPPKTLPPRPTFPMSTSEKNTIFVSVASFRDEECGPMMTDMFMKAQSPQNVYVGIVEQHASTDPPCLPEEWMGGCQKQEFCPNDNIRVRRISPSEAKGPTFGRYLAMLMYRGQKYFLMIDSHNRFIPKWDHVMVDLVQRAPSDKAVLSHYPESWNKEDKNFDAGAEKKTTSRLCKARYLDFGVPRLDAIISPATPNYYPQPWAAAGFLFADARLLHEVPFDPHLDFVFDGEEILYSVRMWTHGWDIYSPGKNTLFHFYYRAKSKKVWSEVGDWHPRQQKALMRVQYLLESTKFNTDERLISEEDVPAHVSDELDIYGLGHARTLNEYYSFAGINKKQRTFNRDWCREKSIPPRDL